MRTMTKPAAYLEAMIRSRAEKSTLHVFQEGFLKSDPCTVAAEHPGIGWVHIETYSEGRLEAPDFAVY